MRVACESVFLRAWHGSVLAGRYLALGAPPRGAVRACGLTARAAAAAPAPPPAGGSSRILAIAGTDASAQFSAQHAGNPVVASQLEQFYIGDLAA